MRRTFETLDAASKRSLGGCEPTPHAASVRIAVLVVVLAACGGAGLRTAKPTLGTIAGLARDHDSGDPVSRAEIRVRLRDNIEPRVTTSNDHGVYDLGRLPPGRYDLTARFAGQPVDVMNIDVRAGETTYVDVVFTLGRPEPLRSDYGDEAGSIDRYRPANLGASVSIIEGTVNDTSTRERVPGAVVTAVTRDSNHDELTQQTVSDDHGRFRFDDIAPGTYSVSAYYSISGRGQIEVRRSQIDVAGAEAVIVPLWIELTR